jgi:hypothetical protein
MEREQRENFHASGVNSRSWAFPMKINQVWFTVQKVNSWNMFILLG